MKVLITGANGFLGQHLCVYLQQKGFSVIPTNRGNNRIPAIHSFIYHSVDLTNQSEVSALLAKVQPDVVIHTAAMSKPDECHTNNAACILQNVTATKYLLEAASSTAIKKPLFIYFSTDFVFGEDGPHREDDSKCPLNFYGESKLKAEEAVIASGLPFIIVRPVFIYGSVWEGLRGSFPHWVQQNLLLGKTIKVVSDQRRTPTYVYDICEGVYQLIVQEKQGVFHLAGKDIISPYQMAVATANVLGLDASLIEEVTSDIFIEPVKRAKRSGLTINKAIAEIGYHPVSFEEGLRLTFNVS